MTIKNSTYAGKNGRYVLGGQTEVSSFALEWWNKINLREDPSDLIYIMERTYEGFPNKLGYVFYADENLSWVIWQYNGIIDPMSELVEGKVLRIPTLDRLKRELFTAGSSVGGVPSTR